MCVKYSVDVGLLSHSKSGGDRELTTVSTPSYKSVDTCFQGVLTFNRKVFAILSPKGPRGWPIVGHTVRCHTAVNSRHEARLKRH